MAKLPRPPKQALTVSIVIPVYNEERHLKPCLDSLAAQSVAPLEVIVVDNNSTDDTPKIAGAYAFVKLLREPRQGVVFARDRGVRAAKGQIIGRIDADSRLPQDWVKQVTAFYQTPGHRRQALAGTCYFYNVRCRRLNRWIVSQFVFRMNRLMVGHYILWGANMAMPRSLWRRVAPQLCHRQDIHEDLDVALHLHKMGYQISYRSNLVVGARMARVFDNHQQLWPYLKLWPQTLRTHQVGDWPLSYVGSAFLWTMQGVPRAAERLARWSGRPPLAGL